MKCFAGLHEFNLYKGRLIQWNIITRLVKNVVQFTDLDATARF